MDKYCVEDLNHLDDTSVNLFDPKDPTITNENFIYSKTQDLHCNIEENDVLVSKNTHDIIENVTACKSTDGVANLQEEFIPEDCVSDEKIEITEHTLELGTIQELEHIFREYNENVADEGTETSQISKIHDLDKTNGKKTEHTLELGTIQELEHIFREYNENVADEGTETSQISKIHDLDKTNGKKARKKTRGQKGKVQTNTLDSFLHTARGRVKKRKRKVSDGLFVRLERIALSDKLLGNTEDSTSSTTSSARTNNENILGTDSQISSKICDLDKTDGKKAIKKTRDQKGKVQTNTLDTFLHKAIGGVKKRKKTVSDGLFVRLETIDISDNLLSNLDNSTSSTTSSARTSNENHLGTDSEISSKICELDKTDGKKARKKTRHKKGTVQTSTLDTILHKAGGGVKNKEINVSDALFVRLKRIDISDKILANSEQRTSSTTSSGRTNNENNLGTDQEAPKGLKLNKLPKQVGNSHQLNLKNRVEDMEQQEIDMEEEVIREKYKCHYCNKILINRKSLKHHINQCHEEVNTIESLKIKGVEDMEQQEIDMEEEVIREKYKCHYCNKILINRKSLKHHINQCHEEVNTPTFQCYHCSKVVKHRRSLISHLRQWHTEGDKLFHCESCLYKTNLKKALVLHVYRVHIPNDQKLTFKCKLCPHEAKLKGDLQMHVNRVHLRKIKTKKCDRCDWKGYSSHFSMHVRTKHLGEEFICDKCNHKATTKGNLVIHQLVHSKAKKFSCAKCTYQTNYKAQLKVHMKSHEDNFQTCPECSKLVHEANFYDHIRNHRRGKLKVKKKCPECGKEVFGLSKHLLTHIGGKVKIPCPECSYSAINGGSVKQHIQKYHGHHKKQERFICYHCNKEIVNKYSLINHLRAVHTDDPCECHICGIKLKSKLYLSIHVRRAHDDVKWLECDLCPEETRFRTKYARRLKWHRVLHLNKDEIIRYKCEYCPYEARVPENLQRHVRKYHLKKLKGRTHSI